MVFLCSSVMVNSDGVAKKKVVKRAKFTRVMLNKLEKNHWKCGKREWTVRIIMFSILVRFNYFIFMFYPYTITNFIPHLSVNPPYIFQESSTACPIDVRLL